MGREVWVWGVRYGYGAQGMGMGREVWYGYGHIALPSAAQQSSDEGLATAVRETMIRMVWRWEVENGRRRCGRERGSITDGLIMMMVRVTVCV